MTQQVATAAPAKEDLLREYDRCFQRWLSMNGQVWQVPALAVTAQAFLFTIMLSADTGQIPRAGSALLAILVSIMSIHVMRKHRHHQSLDYGRMIELEEQLVISSFAQSGWRDDSDWKTRVKGKLTGGRKLQLYNQKWSSVDVWVLGFRIFGAVAVVVGITAFAAPGIYAKWEPPASPANQQGPTTSTATPTATTSPSQLTPTPSATAKPRTTP